MQLKTKKAVIDHFVKDSAHRFNYAIHGDACVSDYEICKIAMFELGSDEDITSKDTKEIKFTVNSILQYQIERI